jgi:hypothetical protein
LAEFSISLMLPEQKPEIKINKELFHTTLLGVDLCKLPDLVSISTNGVIFQAHCAYFEIKKEQIPIPDYFLN